MVRQGGNRTNPLELSVLSDWGEKGKPTPLRREG
ncbi:Cytoplasmic protein (fragment) [Serratia proteamaculans]